MNMNFVAIDFETANRTMSSACSVGLAIVRQGAIAETVEFRIKPKPFYFLPEFVDIHGIRPQDAERYDDFNSVWRHIHKRIAGQCLLAHNARFDREVLNSCLSLYGIKFPEPEFVCTVALARKALPKQPNHRLDTVCGYLGIGLDHHKAGSDAIACAKIALRLCGQNGISMSTGLISASDCWPH